MKENNSCSKKNRQSASEDKGIPINSSSKRYSKINYLFRITFTSKKCKLEIRYEKHKINYKLKKNDKKTQKNGGENRCTRFFLKNIVSFSRLLIKYLLFFC